MRLNALIAATFVSGLMVVAAVGSATPAFAEQIVPVRPFDSVSLDGSGDVRIVRGPVQRVVLREGSTAITDFTFDRRDSQSLHIRTCRDHRCPANYRLVIEIVTPAINDLAINGSGKISVGPGFPADRSRDFAISGSGMIDANALASNAADVAINGSGVIHAGAVAALEAAISGSGRIGYRGHPSVQQAISGSGSIGPDR